MDKPKSGAIEQLLEERRANPAQPSKIPHKLPLSAIHVEPLVFQVRAEGLVQERVEEIARGLDGSNTDEPIHVWWSGLRWIVIEGHHRHAAYKLQQEQQGVAYPVPVVTHPVMSLGEAMGMAGKLNDRDKIRISKEEKLSNAWRMVCTGEGSIRQQSKWSGAGESTISNMRKVKATLLEKQRFNAGRLMDAGWEQCREWANGKVCRDHGPENLEAMAEEMAEELRKLKITSVIKSPDVFARAIEMVSPELPGRLLESDPFSDALHSTGRSILEEIIAERAEGNPTGSDTIEDF